jgi:transposase-like protein
MCRWAFERLGLEYGHERFGMRNRVERLFRHLKKRTVVLHHKLSARNHIQGIKQPKAIPKPIHDILSGREDRRWVKNAYLDTIGDVMRSLLYIPSARLMLDAEH